MRNIITKIALLLAGIIACFFMFNYFRSKNEIVTFNNYNFRFPLYTKNARTGLGLKFEPYEGFYQVDSTKVCHNSPPIDIQFLYYPKFLGYTDRDSAHYYDRHLVASVNFYFCNQSEGIDKSMLDSLAKTYGTQFKHCIAYNEKPYYEAYIGSQTYLLVTNELYIGHMDEQKSLEKVIKVALINGVYWGRDYYLFPIPGKYEWYWRTMRIMAYWDF